MYYNQYCAALDELSFTCSLDKINSNASTVTISIESIFVESSKTILNVCFNLLGTSKVFNKVLQKVASSNICPSRALEQAFPIRSNVNVLGDYTNVKTSSIPEPPIKILILPKKVMSMWNRPKRQTIVKFIWRLIYQRLHRYRQFYVAFFTWGYDKTSVGFDNKPICQTKFNLLCSGVAFCWTNLLQGSNLSAISLSDINAVSLKPYYSCWLPRVTVFIILIPWKDHWPINVTILWSTLSAFHWAKFIIQYCLVDSSEASADWFCVFT